MSHGDPQCAVDRIAEARNLIAHHEQAIALIDDEIDVLTRNIRLLHVKKAKHQKIIRHHKGTTTLARRIPPEILATIFEQLAQEGWASAPVVASHVCPEWRKAAQIPSVWSHLHVYCDRISDQCEPIRFWLQKAKHAPLYITLEVWQTSSNSQISRIMSLLFEAAPQWRTLTVNAFFVMQANCILSHCTHPTPDLREISISVRREVDPAENSDPHLIGFRDSFLESSPKFRTVRVTRSIIPSPRVIPPSITFLFISLPCPNSDTPIDTLSTISVVHLLQGLPLLQLFSLTIPLGQDRQVVPEFISDPIQMVSSGRLETLILRGPPAIYGILLHLDTPSLLRLHLFSSLDPLGFPDEQTGIYLRQFIIQSSPPLEILELHDIDVPEDDLSACLVNLQHLREIRLHESDISDGILLSLHGAEGEGSCYCPHLDTLDLRWCGQISGRALVDLVDSRSSSTDRGLTAIAEITVINCSFVEEKDIEELARQTVCRVVIRGVEDYCCKFEPPVCYEPLFLFFLIQMPQILLVAARMKDIDVDYNYIG